MKNKISTIFSYISFVVVSVLYLMVLFILSFSNLAEHICKTLFDGKINVYEMACIIFVLVLFLCIILNLIYKKHCVKKNNKNVWFLSGVMLLSVIITLVTFNVSIKNIKNFDKSCWINMPLLRTYMISDIEQNYKITEMNKEQVIELLGEPTIKTTESCYEYYVGTNLIDSEFYMITFENDKVISTKTVEH